MKKSLLSLISAIALASSDAAPCPCSYQEAVAWFSGRTNSPQVITFMWTKPRIGPEVILTYYSHDPAFGTPVWVELLDQPHAKQGYYPEISLRPEKGTYLVYMSYLPKGDPGPALSLSYQEVITWLSGNSSQVIRHPSITANGGLDVTYYSHNPYFGKPVWVSPYVDKLTQGSWDFVTSDGPQLGAKLAYVSDSPLGDQNK